MPINQMGKRVKKKKNLFVTGTRSEIDISSLILTLFILIYAWHNVFIIPNYIIWNILKKYSLLTTVQQHYRHALHMTLTSLRQDLHLFHHFGRWPSRHSSLLEGVMKNSGSVFARDQTGGTGFVNMPVLSAWTLKSSQLFHDKPHESSTRDIMRNMAFNFICWVKLDR